MVFSIINFLPDIGQVPHVVLAALAIASAVNFKYQRISGVVFHAVAGVILLALPHLIFSPQLHGEFEPVHIVHQRHTAAFHFGYAIFAFLTRNDIVHLELSVHFAKTVSAFLIVLTHLGTAYQLFEDKARGLHPAPSFLGSVLLFNGVWFASELYQLIRQKYTIADEIDTMVRRTQNWIEGRTARETQVLYWIDSAWNFVGTFLWLAWPGQLLRTVIKREFIIDGINEMHQRELGCHFLAIAILSLLAIQFSTLHQRAYVIQRIVTQLALLGLHTYGHIFPSIYSMGLICTIIVIGVSLAYIGGLVKLLLRVQQEVQAEGLNANGPNQQTIFTVKKTVKAT
jgi:hypothetical protein